MRKSLTLIKYDNILFIIDDNELLMYEIKYLIITNTNEL